MWRNGNLYGPGTAFEPGQGAQAEMTRKRKLPLVGAGTAVGSFVDVKDAADATVTAVTLGPRGIYNIVDDDLALVAVTEARGASSAKAKRDLGWQPSHSSWRGHLGREDGQ